MMYAMVFDKLLILIYTVTEKFKKKSWKVYGSYEQNNTVLLLGSDQFELFHLSTLINYLIIFNIILTEQIY